MMRAQALGANQMADAWRRSSAIPSAPAAGSRRGSPSASCRTKAEHKWLTASELANF